MSLSYAARLSKYPNRGETNLQPDLHPAAQLEASIRRVEELVRAAGTGVVVLSGAGISTSAGIPDFRGPNGVWTREDQNRPSPSGVPFELAAPTLTHAAIAALVQKGVVSHVITQNVDALHLRSGVPPPILSELHGNVFAEACAKCKKKILRDFDVGGVGFRPTGRRCGCGGCLRDLVLDWDDELPEADLAAAHRAIRAGKLLICAGTSLRIQPVGGMPRRAARRGVGVVVINHSSTPVDSRADAVVRGGVDDVFGILAGNLGVEIAPFERWVAGEVLVERRRLVRGGLKFKLTVSFDGCAKVSSPFILAVKFSTGGGEEVTKNSAPYDFSGDVAAGQALVASLRFELVPNDESVPPPTPLDVPIADEDSALRTALKCNLLVQRKVYPLPSPPPRIETSSGLPT
jgi:NAD+-dependent protein deacetylase sirtuin 6